MVLEELTTTCELLYTVLHSLTLLYYYSGLTSLIFQSYNRNSAAPPVLLQPMA